MFPADEHYLNSVAEEVKDNVCQVFGGDTQFAGVESHFPL